MKYAIIISTPPNSVYFLVAEDGDTTHFESVQDCQNWIDENSRPVSDYFIWDVVESCIIEAEPYFGWCEVDGCKNGGANGGGCWRETGYWTVCADHSALHRKGGEQPKMKTSAIEREKTRGTDGFLA